MPPFSATDPYSGAGVRTAGEVLSAAYGPPMSQRGSPGPVGYFGPLTQEHRWDLMPLPARMAVFRKARRFPSVQTGMELLISLILSASWTVEAPRDADGKVSRVRKAYAEHIAKSLGIPTESLGERAPTAMCGRSWDENVRSFMASQFDGFAVRELVCVPDGDGTLWTEIRHLDSATIQRMAADGAGRLAMVVQQPTGMYSAGGVVELEANRIMHLGRQCEGVQFDGIGMLRAILPLVDASARVQNVIASIVERWGLGTSLVEIDFEILERVDPVTARVRSAIEEITTTWQRRMADFVTGTDTAIAPPPWIKLSKFGGEVKGLADLITVCDGLDHRVLQAFMAQFLVLGSGGQTGAYNVAETHSGAAIQMAEGVLRGFCEQLKSYIRRALRWQFGPIDEADMPWLDFTGLQSPLFVDKLAEVVQLAQQGLVPQTRAVKARILKLLGLPPATDAELDAAAPTGGGVKMAPGSGPASGTAPGNAAA